MSPKVDPTNPPGTMGDGGLVGVGGRIGRSVPPLSPLVGVKEITAGASEPPARLVKYLPSLGVLEVPSFLGVSQAVSNEAFKCLDLFLSLEHKPKRGSHKKKTRPLFAGEKFERWLKPFDLPRTTMI